MCTAKMLPMLRRRLWSMATYWAILCEATEAWSWVKSKNCNQSEKGSLTLKRQPAGHSPLMQ